MRLFKLTNGVVFVINMQAYNNQIDIFQSKCRVLEIESYPNMIKRNIGRIIGYIKDRDFNSLSKMFHVWSRRVKLEYIEVNNE